MTSNRTNSTTPTTRQQQQGPLQCYMMANPFRAWTHYGHRPMAKPQRRLRRRGLRLARTSVGARRLRSLDMIASPTDQQSMGHVGRLLFSSGIERHAITEKQELHNDKLHQYNVVSVVHVVWYSSTWNFINASPVKKHEYQNASNLHSSRVVCDKVVKRISACFRTDFETVFTWFKT